MKTYQKILTGAGVAVAGLLLTAAFIDNEYQVQREIVINQPKEQVFQYVRQLKNQDHYSKWVMQDPKMAKSYRGTDGQAGFVYAWDSKEDNAGKGEQEIKSLEEGEAVNTEIRFERPFEAVCHATMTTESLDANQTRVSWGMIGRHPYPINIMNLMMDKALGDDMTESLTKLKNNLEHQALAQ
jgi:uncharacterized membrane protein